MKLVAALLLVLLMAAAAAAQTHPFTGAPAPAPAPTAEPAPPPGFFTQLNREIARFQRDTTREMSQRMRAIRDGETPMALLVGIGLAFLYGVIHAAGPGHGKAVVVGYFLTRQARVGRGLLMGLQISVGHVISAILIALVADIVFRTVWGTAASEIRYIQLASYALIAIIGVYMVAETARGSGLHSHAHCAIPGHDHSHDPHGHSHAHEHRPQGWLSLGVGIVPCTGAILVMLYALANGILFAGFVLVAAIAAGMALTMAGLGVLAIVARNAMARWSKRPEGERGPLAPVFDYAGGVVISLIGAFLFWRAY
jgi:ABC-type nickel/cobalt efflux system permease component RcnA